MKITGNEIKIIHKQKTLDLTDDQSYVVIVSDSVNEVISKFMSKYDRVPEAIYIIDGKPGTHLVPVTEKEAKVKATKAIRFVTNKDKL